MAKRASHSTRRDTVAGCGTKAARVALLTALILAAAGGSRGLAQDQANPVVNVAPVIQAQSAATTALPIQVSPASRIPRQAFLRIRGLPPTVALSEGHSIAVGAWAVPLAALPRPCWVAARLRPSIVRRRHRR